MPYRRDGNKVMHYKDGKWKVKQTCGSVEAAEAAIRLLRGREHGWKPTGKKKRSWLTRKG